MGDRVSIHFADAGQALASCGSVFVTVLRHPMTIEAVEPMRRESLRMSWQFVITSPERSKRMGLHGIGLKFPAPISASILWLDGIAIITRTTIRA